jgi:hypothetical protein
MEGYFACGECCEVDSMSKLIEPSLKKLHKYDARCAKKVNNVQYASWRVISPAANVAKWIR